MLGLGWLLGQGDGLDRLIHADFDYLDDNDLLKTAERMEQKASSARSREDRRDYRK